MIALCKWFPIITNTQMSNHQQIQTVSSQSILENSIPLLAIRNYIAHPHLFLC